MQLDIKMVRNSLLYAKAYNSFLPAWPMLLSARAAINFFYPESRGRE